MTPEGRLYQAVTRGDYQAVEAAFAEGADQKCSRVGGKSLLRTAAELGHRRICELLVRNGADLNESTGARNYSLLHSAVASSNYGLASILLDLGAKPTPLASNKATPLHLAARSGQEYLAENLVSHGAQIDAQDHQGRTPLHYAVEKHDVSMVKLLIKKGCDVNLCDRRYRTALSMAMAGGQNDIKELLVSSGATRREQPVPRRQSRVAESSDNQGRLF